MKVYFTASIYQRDQLKKEYEAIIEAIEKLGHTMCTSFDVVKQSLDVPDGHPQRGAQVGDKTGNPHTNAPLADDLIA